MGGSPISVLAFSVCENSIASDPDMQAEVAMSRLREEKR